MNSTARTPHDAHDRLLIAAFAAGDLSGAAADDATRLLDSCPACRELETDLRAIARATAELPAPIRQRDFQLTAADAARLRQRGWRRIAIAIASPRFSFAQPVGVALTTLGLAGLLLSSIPLPSSTPTSSAGGSAVNAPTAAPAVPEASAAASAAASAPAAEVPMVSASAGAVGAGPVQRTGAAATPAPSVFAAGPSDSAPAAGGGQRGASPPVPNPAAASPQTDTAYGNAQLSSGASSASGAAEGAKSTAEDRNRNATGLLASGGGLDIPPLVLLSLVFVVLGVVIFGARIVARRLSGS